MERGEGEGKKIGDSKEGWRSGVTRGHDRNRNSVHGRGRGGNGPFTRVYMRRHWNIGFATDAHHIRGKIFQRLSTSARVHRPMRPNVLCHRIFTLVKRTPQVYFLSTDLLFRFSSFFFPPFSPVEIVSSFSFPRFRFRFLQRGKMRIVRIGDWKCLKKKKSRLDRWIDLTREPIRNAFVDPRSIMYASIPIHIHARIQYDKTRREIESGGKSKEEETRRVDYSMVDGDFS